MQLFFIKNASFFVKNKKIHNNVCNELLFSYLIFELIKIFLIR